MEKKEFKTTAQPAKASSQEVLGAVGRAHSPDFKVEGKWEKFYWKLRRAREAFLRAQRDQLSQATEENTPSLRRNLAELGTDEYDRELAMSMASADQEALNEIDQALNRLKNGTYGLCEVTGQPIEPARLEAIPWTRFSAEAAARLEAEGQVRKTHLGDRLEVAKPSSNGLDSR